MSTRSKYITAIIAVLAVVAGLGTWIEQDEITALARKVRYYPEPCSPGELQAVAEAKRAFDLVQNQNNAGYGPTIGDVNEARLRVLQARLSCGLSKTDYCEAAIQSAEAAAKIAQNQVASGAENYSKLVPVRKELNDIRTFCHLPIPPDPQP
jgi:hypothetical protein